MVNNSQITSDNPKSTLGLDIGSATIAYVLLDRDQKIHLSGYRFHHGNIHECLKRILSRVPLKNIQQIGINDSGYPFIRNGVQVNEQIALIEAVRFYMSNIIPILHIGAEKFGLILFNKQNRYQKYVSNTGCAAGTGSFLDQQASRLGLKNSAELSLLAQAYQGDPPPIATRCAVFAKTDLIHAQQKGYSLEAICAGLCEGVARNILDTIGRGISLPEDVVLTGGVGLNHKVKEYLGKHALMQIHTLPHPEKLTALGTAFITAKKERTDHDTVDSLDALIGKNIPKKSYHYPPLTGIPYRQSKERPFRQWIRNHVEIELWEKPVNGKKVAAFLGLDIGSTSTKAVIMTESEKIHLGLYTRTLGQPIQAVQNLFRMVRRTQEEYGFQYEWIASGTTGSGRKMIKRVLCADKSMDEITAHARAAVFLEPDVDTILEIGGQDSKFTVLENGRVIFSVMNYVCAAGTGSFLEEQALRLGITLKESSDLAENARAPLTSDRCTVFMERDINYLLSLGYQKEELMAAALHSVRDNYLTKVAHIQKIGNTIVFQGATGKNKALVKAFEQKLGKPVWVSPLCHLTGALGVCLQLKDEKIKLNRDFKSGFDLNKVSVNADICRDCNNHCKILRISCEDEVISWGHLCGKEEDHAPDKKEKREDFIWIKDRAHVFDQLPEPKLHKRLIDLPTLRRNLFTFRSSKIESTHPITIGLPNTLYFMDTLPLWKHFFSKLGYQVIASVTRKDTFRQGKQMTGAEFCAPIALLHGHVHALEKQCDYVFMPVSFRHQTPDDIKTYCYYSNYAVSLIRNNLQIEYPDKLITPRMEEADSLDTQTVHLWRSLPETIKRNHKLEQIRWHLRASLNWFLEKQRILQNATQSMIEGIKDIGILLLGRPYLVLDEGMNHGMIQKISRLGIPSIYQDMLTLNDGMIKTASDLVSWNHWYYGDMIIKAAESIARFPNLFPVYLTAFKCAPDSFIIPYFRSVMARYDKPYLILQLDEHNALEGYETRLEAAVETFRNYKKQTTKIHPVNLNIKTRLEQKTYLLPNYDPLSTRLMTAAFQRHGIKALPIEETEETVKASLRLNDGQCLPVSALTQAIAYTVRNQGLNTEKTVVFVNALGSLSCNLPQYPVYIKQLLNQMGSPMDRIDVYATRSDLIDLPKTALIDIYCAFLLAGLLNKMACRIRPREIRSGDTDRILRDSLERIAEALENKTSRENAFRDSVSMFQAIPQNSNRDDLPKVAIIGDLYVRDNHIFNQNLIMTIEQEGAEAVNTPYTFMARFTASTYFHKLKEEKKYLIFALEKTLLSATFRFDKKYMALAYPVLGEKVPDFDLNYREILKRYHLSVHHRGETSQNLLKIYFLLKQYPGIRLFVHVNPVFCCPALISESLFKKIETDIGIPIVSITYDGTQTRHNQVLIPYLHFINQVSDSVQTVKSG